MGTWASCRSHRDLSEDDVEVEFGRFWVEIHNVFLEMTLMYGMELNLMEMTRHVLKWLYIERNV